MRIIDYNQNLKYILFKISNHKPRVQSNIERNSIIVSFIDSIIDETFFNNFFVNFPKIDPTGQQKLKFFIKLF